MSSVDDNKQLSEFERYKIIAFSDLNWNQQRIADELKCNQSTVSRIVAKWKQHHTVSDLPRTGRPPAFANNNNNIENHNPNLPLPFNAIDNAINNGHYTIDEIKTHIQQQYNRTVKRSSIAKYRRQLRFRRVRFRDRPLIMRRSTYHRRYEYCLDHLDSVWHNTIFTDEVNFTVGPQRLHLWKRRHDTPRFRYVRKYPEKIMFWGGVHWNGKTELVRINGTVTAISYRDLIKRHLVNTRLLDEYELLHDGATVHTGGAAKDYFDANPFTVNVIPPHSPELNVVEKIWGWMKHRLELLPNPPQNKTQLEAAVRDIWDNQLTLPMIRRFIRHQRTVINDIVVAGGQTIQEQHRRRPRFRNDVV